jgi:hypothetical protein
MIVLLKSICSIGKQILALTLNGSCNLHSFHEMRYTIIHFVCSNDGIVSCLHSFYFPLGPVG